MRFVAITLMAAAFISGCDQPTGNTGAVAAATAMKDTATFTSIEWKETSIDFGKIPEGKRLDIVYNFKNTGSTPLVISKVEPGCGCTVAETPSEPIGPGKDGHIKASFDSNNRIGTQHKSIYVYANTKGIQRHELVFQAEVEQKK